MLHWEQIDHFKANEFPEDPSKYADPQLIYNLDFFRELLNSPVYPSPVQGALARFSGSTKSRHYAVNRKSTAIDVFPEGSLFKAWLKAIDSHKFKGIGVYFDTHYQNVSWGMLHLDMRLYSTLWFRDEGEYTYTSDPDFWEKLTTCFFKHKGLKI